jgi:uncharacterized protein (DUF1501 family)
MEWRPFALIQLLKEPVMLTHNLQIQIAGDGGILNRRSFLRNVAAGSALSAAGLGALGWIDTVRAEAQTLRKKGMSCILLFMRGAPSQFETFDPKPGTATGGPTTAIKTAVPDIEIAEGWEKTAAMMKEIAVLRSIHSKEGQHDRAVHLLHTGYLPSGSVKYPGMGSIVASELADPGFDLPHFISIGGGGANFSSSYLGMQYSAFVVNDPNRMPQNVELPQGINADRLKRRLGLMDKLQRDFEEAGGKHAVADQKALYQSAARLVLSPRLKAFDLSQEKDATKARYGASPFGQGCLLARRLVEAGVTFVEVASNGWDTHEDNFNRVKRLAGQTDPAIAALIQDLKERGMLDKTLVIWMGEFGRTPNINARTGRDHYPRSFNALLAGGGIKGGQVVGATDKEGRGVKEDPISVPDLFCTIYHALKIDPRKENHSAEGRPIKLVDGGNPVKQLFG